MVSLFEGQTLTVGGDISRAARQFRDDETALIQAAQQGDLEAFEALVKRYQDRVIATAYRLVNQREDAEDIAQEAFVRAFRSLNGFQRERKFYTWLYRIVIHVCWDFLRRQRRFETTSIEATPQQDVAAITELPWSDKEDADRIMRLIHRLSVPQKTVFLLREVEGFSCKEIAHILDLPAGTVRSHLFYARRQLQEWIRRKYPELLEGITSIEKTVGKS